MEVVQAYFDGNVFVPLVPVKAKVNQSAIITIMDNANADHINNRCSEFFGVLSAESYEEIMEALNDTEAVDENEW